MTFRASTHTVPSFPLYGESGAWSTPEPLHCESIAARSALHDWEIRPHRHEDLCQLLFVEAGTARATLDGVDTWLDGPAFVFMPARVIHGYRFAPDIAGHVVTLPVAVMLRLVGEAAPLPRLNRPAVLTAETDRDFMHEAAFLINALAGEFAGRRQGGRQGRLAALESLATLLLLGVSRRLPDPPAASAPPATESRIARFFELVEAGYSTHQPVATYAAALNISLAQLNKSLRRATGKSALAILHERLLLEARRNLIYTSFGVGDIAHLLGFSDPAYFSRFFTRHTGQSPRAYRQAARAAMRGG